MTYCRCVDGMLVSLWETYTLYGYNGKLHRFVWCDEVPEK